MGKCKGLAFLTLVGGTVAAVVFRRKRRGSAGAETAQEKEPASAEAEATPKAP